MLVSRAKINMSVASQMGTGTKQGSRVTSNAEGDDLLRRRFTFPLVNVYPLGNLPKNMVWEYFRWYHLQKIPNFLASNFFRPGTEDVVCRPGLAWVAGPSCGSGMGKLMVLRESNLEIGQNGAVNWKIMELKREFSIEMFDC